MDKKSAVRAFFKKLEERKKQRQFRDKMIIKDNFVEINCEQTEEWVFRSAERSRELSKMRN